MPGTDWAAELGVPPGIVPCRDFWPPLAAAQCPHGPHGKHPRLHGGWCNGQAAASSSGNGPPWPPAEAPPVQ